MVTIDKLNTNSGADGDGLNIKLLANTKQKIEY